MKKTIIITLIITITLLIFGAREFIIFKDNYDLDKDLIKKIADNEVNQNDTNEIKAIKLLNYVYINSNGDCVTKSFYFERLLTSQNIPNRHITLIQINNNTIESHATTQALINNTWTFYDSTTNKITTEQEYKQQGFTYAITQLNCIDGKCTNINTITYQNFNKQLIWTN